MRTNVEGNPVELIEGGAQRGANLFHSFSEFNVSEGRGAYFANPTGIENILGRVTGANPSQILGTLGVLGNADLFLINPNGIIFGQNARLDVNGSFLGSTADSLLFPDGEFSATDTQTEPLLTVNVPIGLGLGDNPGAIVNRSFALNSVGDDSVGLEVPPGKNLILVGGDINFEGGEATASGGRIELGGLQEAGTVTFNSDGSLSFPIDVARADVTLSNNAADVFVRGIGGGEVVINARNLNLEAGEFGFSRIRAGISSDSTDSEAQAGDITINATNDVTIDDSVITNLIMPEAVGEGGDINITTNSLSVTNGGLVFASTNERGQGDAGSISITASDTIIIDGEDSVGSPSGIGSEVGNDAVGESGDITIATDSLFLTNGGAISTGALGQGNAGTISITASDTIIIDGEDSNGVSSGISSEINRGVVGESGEIAITTSSLFITNGGTISSGTEGRGNAGTILITASDTITIDGEDSDGFPSGVSSQVNSNAEGNGGNITITTDSLSLTNSGLVSAATAEQGDAGSISITASDTITIDGEDSDGFPSGVSSQVVPGAKGNGGNITITTNSLSLTNGGGVSASTFGRGNAGNINVTAFELTLQNQGILIVNGQKDSNPGNLNVTADNISLDNQSFIAAETESGSQGNITLNTQLLTLRDNSQITTNARGSSTGGNITINVEDGFIIAVPDENSDITANATAASGGQVTINARSLFGIEAREQQTPLSDITASSDLGVQFGGDVTINTPEVDPESGLNELPTVPIDAEAIIAQNFCRLENDRIADGSSFTIIGKGGLPPTAQDPVINQTRIVDWATPTESTAPQQPEINSNSDSIVAVEKTQPVIQQARGWAKTKDGKIVLTADAPIIVPQTGEIGYPNCTVN